MAAEIIFTNSLFVRYILPFLLLFVIVFAILEKTNVLGNDKRQINAIIALVVALIFVSFSYATSIVVKLIPFLAVSLVIIFIFMVIFGFIMEKSSGSILNKELQITLGIIFGLGVIVAVLWSSGVWDNVYGYFINLNSSSGVFINVLMVGIIIAAIALVLRKSGGSPPSDGGD